MKRGTRKNSNKLFNINNLILPKSKRSQVTTFIIIGVIILAGILIYFFMNIKTKSNVNSVPEVVSPINLFVLNCLDNSLKDSIIYVSGTGGYYILPQESNDLGISYYLSHGKNLMPSKESIEKEISNSINDKMFFCLNDFSDFPDFNISYGNITSDVKIKNESVSVKLDLPLSILKDDKSYSLKSFESYQNVRLGVIYNAVLEMIRAQMPYTEGICIQCFYDPAQKNDLYVTSVNYGGGYIYTVVDTRSILGNETLTFNFANKYDFK